MDKEKEKEKEEEEEKNLEPIILAIRNLLQEKNNDQNQSSDQILLSRLLSQIESMKEGTKPGEMGSEEIDSVNVEYREEIVKELKKVKKQNLITHCLLSVMIVLTVVWQLSEVSIILNVKNKISNPFKFLGSLVFGALKTPKTIVEETASKQKQNHYEDSSSSSVLPSLKISKLLHVDLPEFGFDGVVKH